MLAWVQLVAKQEDFEREAISVALRNKATTAGVHLEFGGGKVRLLANYVSRKIGEPGKRTGLLITQLQVKYSPFGAFSVIREACSTIRDACSIPTLQRSTAPESFSAGPVLFSGAARRQSISSDVVFRPRVAFSTSTMWRSSAPESLSAAPLLFSDAPRTRSAAQKSFSTSPVGFSKIQARHSVTPKAISAGRTSFM